MNTLTFEHPQMLHTMTRKVADILVRDGGITHLTAMHYGIGCITKEIQRLRDASPKDYKVITVRRQDADGHKYTRWTLKKAA